MGLVIVRAIRSPNQIAAKLRSNKMMRTVDTKTIFKTDIKP